MRLNELIAMEIYTQVFTGLAFAISQHLDGIPGPNYTSSCDDIKRAYFMAKNLLKY